MSHQEPAGHPGDPPGADETPLTSTGTGSAGPFLLPWAIFLARVHLGLMFFMPGVWRVFRIGPLEHARRFFVEPYAETFLPEWTLWVAGTTIPFLELLAGALLLIGLWRRSALIALGLELAVITFGHLLAEPLFAFHSHVLPRLVLLLFLMVVPLAQDRWALDAKRRAGG